MIKTPFVHPNATQPKITDEPYDRANLSMIVGNVGTGKTTLMLQLMAHLESVHDWDECLLITGSKQDPALKAVECPISTNPADLEVWLTKVRQPPNDGKPKYNLLVIDDIIGNKDFNVFTNRGTFTDFILNHRHFGEVEVKGKKKGGTWVIMVAQRLSGGYSKTVRNQVNIFYMFYPRNATELKEIEAIGDDKTRIKKAMELLRTEGKHQFLTINKMFTPYLYMMSWDQPLDLD